MTALRAATATWVPVCPIDSLPRERGVAALVGGRQIAVFRTFDETLHAIGNCDPFTGASVLARGIVGSRAAVPTVASPLHKQVFDLDTGTCLDDPAVAVPVYPVRCVAGMIEISVGAP